MDHEQFDIALIQAALARAEIVGWQRVTVADAARDAGLPLDEARVRFPMRSTVLMRLGILADRAALIDDGSVGTIRERLFDLLMRRIDVLQQYREGVRSVLRAARFDPPLALLLAGGTVDSMNWIAQAVGLDSFGILGRVRAAGLTAVWLQAMRAWDRDDSPDLAGTMAALDQALDRAERFGRMMERPLLAGDKSPAAAPSGLGGAGPDAPGPDVVDLLS